MKKLLLFIALICIISCTKDNDCYVCTKTFVYRTEVTHTDTYDYCDQTRADIKVIEEANTVYDSKGSIIMKCTLKTN